MYKKQLTLRLSEELYQQLRREAERLHITKQDLLILILNSYCSYQGVRGLPQVSL